MSWNIAAIATSLGLVLVGCGKKDTPKAPEAQKTAPAEKPAEKPAEAPAEKPAEAPAEKPAEAPAEKPAEAPAEKPAEAPAEKPAEAPADPNAKPAEAPADPNAAPAAAADRAQAVVAGMLAFSEGRLDESFAGYADGAVWAVPGLPEVQGKAAILEQMKGNRTAMPDLVVRPSHVFEMGGKVVAIYVMKGTNTGPMGDKPATGKAVAVEGAMIFDFDEAGKVMRVTDFFDLAALMTQLGVVPTPEGAPAPAPIALPESTEMVKAPANEANLATTNAIMAAMTATGFEAKMREVLAADFSMRDPGTGQILTGVDAVVTNMKEGLFKMWPDYTATVQQCWSAGDWVICQVDNKGTYKGGIPGVEGKDQATRFASLDFTKYEGGKAKTYKSFTNGMQIMEQLGAVPGAAPAPAPEGGAAPAPEGGAAPAPEGGAAPAPEGGAAPAPEGGAAPAPEGGAAPAPAPAPAEGAAPAPAEGAK
ncbi:MAG: ester cyclase [Myxococcales bacterium]|nr:ester cyclase [Myxococcales bacterium]